MILFHFENVGNFHTQCSALLLNITFTVHFHYLIFMAQLPELSDLNILTPSGLLAEAVKLCSNTQMLKTLNATFTQTQLFVTYFIIIVHFGLIKEFAKIKRQEKKCYHEIKFTAEYTMHN